MSTPPPDAPARNFRLALISTTVVIYILVFGPLYQLGWSGVVALSAIPVILTAWFFGFRVGVITSLLVFPLNVLLLSLAAGQPAWDTPIWANSWLNHMILVVVAAAIGRLCDLSERLKRELAFHRQADITMRESEGMLRLISEQSIVGLSIIQDNRIKYATEAVAIINGYSTAEMLSWSTVNFAKMIHPDDLAFAVEQVRKKQEGDPNIITHYAYRLITKNQEIKWVEQYSRTIAYDGRPADLIILIDIGERKRAEEQLQKSQKRYRDLVDNSQGIICTHDLDGVLQSVNPATSQLLGYQTDELVGRNLREFLVPATRHLLDNYLETIRKEPAASGLMRVTTKDGQERILMYQNVRRDEPGEASYVLSHCQDVTEQKKAEHQLRSSDRQLRLLLEQAPALLWTTDTNLRVTSVVGTGLASLGLVPEQILGKTLYEYFQTVDPKFVAIEGHLRALEGHPATFEQERGGHVYQSYLEPLRDRAGRIIGCIALAVEITERKAAEKQKFEIALQRNRVDLLRTIIRDMSHELKTPLAVINSCLYLIEKISDPEKRKERLDTIKVQIHHLDTVIQDILALSQLDNAPELSFKPLNLNSLLAGIEKKIRPEVERKELTLQLKLSDLPLIPADEDALDQAFVNLVENAVHYTPNGGTVTIQTDTQSDVVMVEVQDTGIGINPSELTRIFEHFYRTDEARVTDKGGTGLGLPIAKKIVELHRGSIDVESTPGLGSTFRIRLPVAQTSPE